MESRVVGHRLPNRAPSEVSQDTLFIWLSTTEISYVKTLHTGMSIQALGSEDFMEGWMHSTSFCTISYGNQNWGPDNGMRYISSIFMFVQNNPDEMLQCSSLHWVYTIKPSILNIKNCPSTTFLGVQWSIIAPSSLGDMWGVINNTYCINTIFTHILSLGCLFIYYWDLGVLYIF